MVQSYRRPIVEILADLKANLTDIATRKQGSATLTYLLVYLQSSLIDVVPDGIT